MDEKKIMLSLSPPRPTTSTMANASPTPPKQTAAPNAVGNGEDAPVECTGGVGADEVRANRIGSVELRTS